MKFLDHLAEAQRIVSVIDHMYYVTYPLVKDKRMLLKILTESQKALYHMINAVLQHEYLLTRITLYKDKNLNFRNFEVKCAPIYLITSEEVKLIRGLFEIVRHHERSSVEFKRSENIVILTDEAKPLIITESQIKNFLLLSKSVLQKVTKRIRANYKNP